MTDEKMARVVCEVCKNSILSKIDDDLIMIGDSFEHLSCHDDALIKKSKQDERKRILKLIKKYKKHYEKRMKLDLPFAEHCEYTAQSYDSLIKKLKGDKQ